MEVLNCLLRLFDRLLIHRYYILSHLGSSLYLHIMILLYSQDVFLVSFFTISKVLAYLQCFHKLEYALQQLLGRTFFHNEDIERDYLSAEGFLQKAQLFLFTHRHHPLIGEHSFLYQV